MPPHTQVRNHGTATPQQGSATQTITGTTSALRNSSPDSDSLVLRLRGAHRPTQSASRSPSPETAEQSPSQRNRRTIQWAEDVVDNEGLGRKKSKVCCIYHKNREVGESSSEDDSSSSSSDSDSSSADDGAARPSGRKVRRGKRHNHRDGDGCNGHDGHGHDEHSKSTRRKASPNAYEKMPKYDVQPLQRQPLGS